MEKWHDCKNILCIRTDNMGDLLMSIPAMRALKETFHCTISLLTSSLAAPAAAFIPEVTDVIPFSAPWNRTHAQPEETAAILRLLQQRHFDAAIILTVYSQNPLPAALLAFQAGIPRRLAYCRENPYGLLTEWLPEEEPYTLVRHQVQRELRLVQAVGAQTRDDSLSLELPENEWPSTKTLLQDAGVALNRPWVIVHTAASEQKRAFPEKDWITTARSLKTDLNLQLLFTGTLAQRPPIENLCRQIGTGAVCLAGRLSLPGLIMLIAHAPLLISVNTAPVHIAAATGCRVVVLYALTNPQHTPWRAHARVLHYHPPIHLQSKNQVVQYAYNRYLKDIPDTASPEEIILATRNLLNETAHTTYSDHIT